MEIKGNYNIIINNVVNTEINTNKIIVFINNI